MIYHVFTMATHVFMVLRSSCELSFPTAQYVFFVPMSVYPCFYLSHIAQDSNDEDLEIKVEPVSPIVPSTSAEWQQNKSPRLVSINEGVSENGTIIGYFYMGAPATPRPNKCITLNVTFIYCLEK